MGFMLILFAGLATDTAYVVLSSQELQHAADAAALAAVRELGTGVSDARTKAVDIAGANTVRKLPVVLDRNNGNVNTGDIVVGRYNRAVGAPEPRFIADDTDYNAVKVNARRGLSLIFGSAFGFSTVDLESSAIAMVGTSGITINDPTASCALDLNGSQAVISVMDVSVDPPLPSAIQVNSNNTGAVCTSGQPTIEAGELNIVGDGNLSGANFSGVKNAGAPYIPDPLGDVDGPAKPYPACETPVPNNYTDITIGSGHYCEGFKLNGGILRLNPGIYILSGDGLQLSGGASLIGTNVMLYIADTGDKKTAVDMSGGGTVQLSPMTSGMYKNITIFQARDNHNDAKITGNGNMTITGILYFPENHLELAGDGGNIGNQIIVGTLTISGNASVSVDYDPRTAAGGTAFLVH